MVPWSPHAATPTAYWYETTWPPGLERSNRPMRSEILISQTEATTASARASMRGCHASYVPAGTWLDVATGMKRTAFNHNPAPGPGGTS